MTICLTDDSLLFIHCPAFYGPILFICLFVFDNSSTFQFTFTLRINFRAENWSHFPCLALVKRQGQKFTSRMGMFCCCEIWPLWSCCSWRVPNSRLVTEPLPWKCSIGAKAEKGKKNPFTCLELDDSVFLVKCMK